MQGGGTELVLPAYELLLMLQGVTAHQEPVRWLAALVGADRELTELNRGGEVTLVEVHPGQVFQGMTASGAGSPPAAGPLSSSL
jgi:hypothetical protein